MRLRRLSAVTLLAVFASCVLALPALALAQERMPPMGPMGADEASAAAGAGCMSCGCVAAFVIAVWAVFIAVAVWVYRDAQARNMEPPVLWLLLVLVTGLIGLIIYLIVRKPRPG